MSLSMKDLAEIRKRAEAATKGPWRKGEPDFRCVLSHYPHGKGECVYSLQGWTDYGSAIHRDSGARTSNDASGDMVAGAWNYEEGGVRMDADREFIAAARTDIPALLECVERMQGALSNLLRALDNSDIDAGQKSAASLTSAASFARAALLTADESEAG